MYKVLLSVIAYYLCLYGSFFILLSIAAPLISGIIIWVFTGQLVIWDNNIFLKVIKLGILITPFASFLYAINRCEEKHGFNKKIANILLVILLILFIVTVVFVKEYTNWMR